MKTLRTILVHFARLVVAVTFILSGYLKAVDPLGTQYKIEEYLLALNINGPLPSWGTLLAAIILLGVEFSIGVMLLLAAKKRLVAWATFVFMAIMTVVTIWIYVADPVSNCGCFGDAVVLSNSQTLLKNIALLILSIIILFEHDKMFRFLSDGNSSIAFYYSILFVVGTALYCLYYLPLFDFRPYHIGANIAEETAGTANKEPTIYDFSIDTPEGENVTKDVLSHEGYTFLLIAPYLDEADDTDFGSIDQIYEYAQDYDYPFYCLTASTQRAIARWQDSTGAEYPFYFTDGTTLKTVVRSNPGMLLLKDGVIIQKWSHHNLPREEELNAPLPSLPIGKEQDTNTTREIIGILLLYILPILLLSIADRLWAWRKRLKSKKGA